MGEGEKGLTSSEAKRKLESVGSNILPEKKPPSDLTIFISQIKSPLVFVLIFAGIVTFFLEDFSDSLIIGLAIFLNTILGFFQERRANNALSALKKLVHPATLVMRDGKRVEISIEEVVPGDLCVLGAGDKIPADGKLIFANRMFVSEAVLTGESLPVAKQKGDDAFMGTVITSGRGRLLVEKTGAGTEIGKIAQKLQETSEETPLRKQLSRFAKQLTWVVVLLTLFVFVAGIISGKNILEIFTTSVALAVSAIPEGLLVGLTVVLAIGMQRILKRKGLVRNLVSAETLGGVTTICMDKTGTLTEGAMRVVEVVGNETDIARQSVLANDLDDPIVTSAWEWAEKKLTNEDLGGKNLDDFQKQNPRIDSIPFSSKDRFFASLNAIDGNKELFVNGAPEYLLSWSNLHKTEKKKIEKQIEQLTSKGYRLIAMAKKRVPDGVKKISEAKVRKDLSWVGIIALSDPVREGVKDALKKARMAGVKIVVITGDYAQTATFVLSGLGLNVDKDMTILGDELTRMSEDMLLEKLKRFSDNGSKVFLFARTTPEQKLKIVDALKKEGEVVAMLGDGVNDALALKKADIGVVVGTASDVAKETADLVLVDSSFATIVAAIEEGRGIFDNIRKIILYLMSDAFEEIVLVILTLILKLPLPITAAQILWINLVSDGFPHLALTIDPKDPDIMKYPPRDSKELLVTDWMKKLIFIVSIWGGLVGFVLFVSIYHISGDLKLAQSVAFATLGANSLIYVFSVRTLTNSFLHQNPFENKWLNIAVFAGLIFQVFPFVFESTRNLLGIESLGFVYWLIIFTASFLMFMMIEVAKRVLNKHLVRT